MFFTVISILGLLSVTAGLVVKKRKTRDALSFFGGLLLLVYSVHIRETIFIMLQAIYTATTIFDYLRNKNA